MYIWTRHYWYILGYRYIKRKVVLAYSLMHIRGLGTSLLDLVVVLVVDISPYLLLTRRSRGLAEYRSISQGRPT